MIRRSRERCLIRLILVAGILFVDIDSFSAPSHLCTRRAEFSLANAQLAPQLYAIIRRGQTGFIDACESGPNASFAYSGARPDHRDAQATRRIDFAEQLQRISLGVRYLPLAPIVL